MRLMRGRRTGPAQLAIGAVSAVLLASGCTSGGSEKAPQSTAAPVVVPRPAELTLGSGAGYALTTATAVHAEGGDQARQAAELVAGQLGLPVAAGSAAGGAASAGDGIDFRLDPKAGTGSEGYLLTSGSTGVTITAADGAGLFYL
jgi:hexosaminidase